MKRPRHLLPTILKKHLSYNQSTGYYEITEEDITYHLTLEQTVLLKQYFHDHSHEKPTPSQ